MQLDWQSKKWELGRVATNPMTECGWLLYDDCCRGTRPSNLADGSRCQGDYFRVREGDGLDLETSICIASLTWARSLDVCASARLYPHARKGIREGVSWS